MGLSGIAHFAEQALLWWLAVVVAVVLYRCLNGGVVLAGMLARSEQHQAEGRPAPERVQLLFSFFIAVAAYARLTLAATQGGAVPVTRLPEAPTELVALFAASHGIYLSGKLGRMLNLGRFISSGGG